jgi:superfamily II DNA/RNA helicase
MTFDLLGLSDALLKAVTESGYSEPTPIQRQAIPVVLQGRDVLGIAQTGTGKTASFVLPMLDILAEGRTRARMPRSLILEPTRELAVQVAENFDKYGKHLKLTKALLIGGVAFGDQDKALDKGVDVLIATPGRLIDQVERSKVMLSGVEILVIDEADRMLDMGFIPDVERICSFIPGKRQTLFFSATMPPPVKKLADRFLKEPKTIEVSRPATTATLIAQTIVETHEKDKRETLRRLLQDEPVQNGIVFCNRKRDVRVLYDSLKRHGFNVVQLHGDMDQSERLAVMDRFRTGDATLLVASDVAARGLDISAVSHVFNFDVPFHADDYVHRIGRTGRAGRSGTAIMLATRRDGESIEAIEKLIGQKIPRRAVAGAAPEPNDSDTGPTAAREQPPRRDRRARSDRTPRGDKRARPEPAVEQIKPEAPGSRSRGPREDDKPSGLGDQIPAFLLVSARS